MDPHKPRSMDVGANEIIKTVEAKKELPPGVERLTPRSREEFAAVLSELEYDATSGGQKEDRLERREELEEMYRHYLEHPEHSGLFVIRKEGSDEIIGVVGYQTKPSSNEATIDLIQHKHAHSQQDVIERLLDAVAAALAGRYHPIKIEGKAKWSSDLSAVVNRDSYSHLFSGKEEGEDRHHMESRAA